MLALALILNSAGIAMIVEMLVAQHGGLIAYMVLSVIFVVGMLFLKLKFR